MTTDRERREQGGGDPPPPAWRASIWRNIVVAWAAAAVSVLPLWLIAEFTGLGSFWSVLLVLPFTIMIVRPLDRLVSWLERRRREPR